MLDLLPTKFASWLLLMAMFLVTVASVCQTSHASEAGSLSSAHHAAVSAPGAAGDSPSPLDQHGTADDCHDCAGCDCHSLVSGQPIRIVFNLVSLEVGTSDPFQYLPEVYLSRFVPPQIRA
jgi:hypothetical protein